VFEWIFLKIGVEEEKKKESKKQARALN